MKKSVIKQTLLKMLIPTVFAASAILTLYYQNIGAVTSLHLAIPLFTSCVFAIVVTYLLFLLFRNKDKTIVFGSFFFVLFFSYTQIGYIQQSFYKILEGIHIQVQYIFFPVWIFVFTYIFIRIQRSKRSFENGIKFLSIVSVISILFPIVGIVHYELTQRIHPEITSSFVLPDIKTPKAPPDIYYIVPDSYASSENLSKYFSYDNSDFQKFLVDKGFYIRPQATSNYPTTLLSLASTLNMEYLDYLSKYTHSSDVSIAKPLIENSNVHKLLRSVGYKSYHIGSWWWPTAYNRYANTNYNLQEENQIGIDEFAYTALKSTMLDPILKKIIPDKVIGESDEDKRAIILYQFKALQDIVKQSGPKFVFAHIIAPHGPYVFDKECNFTSYNQNWNQPEEKNYIDQVNCINKKLEATIDTILKDSTSPPIILLQTDEGAKFIAELLSPSENWQSASREMLQKKFPILSAYYFPGIDTDILSESTSSVNTFRYVFNLYFGTSLPLVPDKNYIYLDAMHLYDFKDVTDSVKK